MAVYTKYLKTSSKSVVRSNTSGFYLFGGKPRPKAKATNALKLLQVRKDPKDLKTYVSVSDIEPEG